MKKQYKLLKKYPSLPDDWEEGMVIGTGDRSSFTGYSPCNGKYTDSRVHYREVLDSNFWERVVEEEIQELKCGQLVYRVWDNGKKSLGILGKNSIKDGFYTNENREPPTHFKALENFNECGEVRKGETYGMGKYEYEIAEKDYEILTLVASDKLTVLSYEDGGLYGNNLSKTFGNKDYWLECFLDSKQWNIHSVRRLLDGEVFSFGDIDNFGKITGFEIKEGKIISKYYKRGDWQWLSSIHHLREPLFKTEDEVDIFAGDKYWVVDDETFYIWRDCVIANKFSGKNLDNGVIRFSTIESAEEFIVENKPCLSLKEIKGEINLYWTQEMNLEKLVKSKL